MLARSLRPAPAALRLAVARRGYHKNIIDHYETPRNVGSFDKEDLDVGTGLVGAPACGDVMKLQLKIGKDGKIEDAVFKARVPLPLPLPLLPLPRRPVRRAGAAHGPLPS